MKYSIIIPTYNHCDDLLKPCVEAIVKYTKLEDIELIIVANGCKDETREYLKYLESYFSRTNIGGFKSLYFDDALGYAKSNNKGLEVATCDKIVLLNNDAFLLAQEKSTWLTLLNNAFRLDPKCGISCSLKGHSDAAGRDFAIFFCVMIKREVFDKIGYLNEEYGVGGSEDIEFCIEAENAGYVVTQPVPLVWNQEAMIHVGTFPIYHRGEGTVHDSSLVPKWNDIFHGNTLKLAKKYNPKWYQWKISNNSERAVFFKGDPVTPRELTRYTYAAKNIVGRKILEIGCSSGYGVQFLPPDIDYAGIDYDDTVIHAARDQEWSIGAKFIHADANYFEYEQYDTIIAFESIEHIPNGAALVERLKNHCKKMIITVPFNENPGQFSPHHVNHRLVPTSFSGFRDIGYIDINGAFIKGVLPPEGENSMLVEWAEGVPGNKDHKKILEFMKETPDMYAECIEADCYRVTANNLIPGRNVLDIGANIGAFSILAGILGARKVISVEPVSVTFNKMLNNIKQAHVDNVFPLQRIVATESGATYKMSLNENSGHNSRYNVSERFEEVSTITFSDLMAQFEGDDILLKLDCEGAEYDILMNATQEEMARISHVSLEIHAELHPTYKGFEIIENKLREFGFRNIIANQIFFWKTDANGNTYDWSPLPYKVEIWER